MNRRAWIEIMLLLSLGVVQFPAIFVEAADSGFSTIPVQVAGSGKAGFTSLDPKITGVGITNVLQGDVYLTNAVAHNGSGLAIGDVDGDGWADIYFCRLQGPNVLYRNLGNWRFQESAIGEAACPGQFSTGAALADVDGDYDLDLLVNGIATGTRLFQNEGSGRFVEIEEAGLSRTASATSLALADIDGDGDLDLYCAHYIDVMHLSDPTMRFSIMMRDGQWVVLKVNDEPATLPKWKGRFEALPGGRVRELPEVHGFYRNDGRGRFTAIEFEKGTYADSDGNPVGPFRDWGLAAMFRDLNGDGAPDLYVCNDNASPDRIWMNSGTGTFRAADPLAFRHTSRSSMGVDIADVNRDGRDDIFVLDMFAREHGRRMMQLVRDHSPPEEFEQIGARPRYNRNALHLQRADGSFAEVGLMAGLAASDWSWCPIFLDVDLDGYEDLLVSNGFAFDVMDQDSSDQIRMQRRMSREQLKRSRRMHPSWFTANAAFRNRGDGTFEPMAREWGFDLAGVSNGMALGDLDNDGDLDVVINNFNAVASLLRNDSVAPRLAVRLKGRPPNTAGVGARLTLITDALTQTQEMISGGRYMSSDQSMRVLALPDGSAKSARLEVHWRNGERSCVTNLEANHIYEVDQRHASRPTPKVVPPKPAPFFEDASKMLRHRHRDDAFDDWSRQPLLPHRLSRLGPGVCWSDLNGDGWEDLVVSSGRGGTMTALLNQHGTDFQSLTNAPAIPTDQGAVVSWTRQAGSNVLLVATSNYELAPGQTGRIAAYPAGKLDSPEYWRADLSNPGPLSMADIDNDGDLDLFMGGHFIPGQYPAPASSVLWINEQGTMKPNPALSAPFEKIGLVSGATFADLDNDGWPDLALAMDWSALRIFRNEHGQFKDTTSSWGLDRLKGRWLSITAGDFNGDGNLDLAAGNWGRNTPLELYFPGPWRLFYGDWNGDGIADVIEAARRGADCLPMRDRRAMAFAFPDLPSRFQTHEAYGTATVKDLLEEAFTTTPFVEASHLETCVFLNRGSRFEPVSLSAEAQRAPTFGLSVADFDGDGIDDLFLAQNFFGTASGHSREDAGTGLWLRGKGDGTFSPVDSTVSGIKVHGEQRGAAVADFNHDGRVDLAVAQNNAETKLFVNRAARQGLRVKLTGPANNPTAVGAQVRVIYAQDRRGPVRSIQAGSGYWSQDAAVPVLGLSAPPVALWIRWPGGKEQTIPVADASDDAHVTFTP